MQDAPMPPSAGGRVYQLVDGNVSPTRVVGRSPEGLPSEETIQVIKHEMFVDLDGNICPVLLRNGRVSGNSPEEERYELLMRRDQITAGCLPLSECPYTGEYRRITGAPTLLGEPPEGARDCGGKPDGCEHLKPVIEQRRARCRERYEAQEKQARNITQAQAEALVLKMAQGFAAGLPAAQVAPVEPPSASDARKNLRTGKGE